MNMGAQPTWSIGPRHIALAMDLDITADGLGAVMDTLYTMYG